MSSVVPAKAGTHTSRPSLLNSMVDGFAQEYPLVVMGPGSRSRAACPPWPPRHDRNRIEGVDRLAVLVMGGPFDADDALGLRSRRGQLDHLPFEMERVAWPYRLHPAQFVHARPEQGMRPKRPAGGGELHGDRRGMPSRCGESSEDGVLGRLFVEVKRLRIEFRGKAQDVFLRHRYLAALEAHAELQIVEPFNRHTHISLIAIEFDPKSVGLIPNLHRQSIRIQLWRIVGQTARRLARRNRYRAGIKHVVTFCARSDPRLR